MIKKRPFGSLKIDLKTKGTRASNSPALRGSLPPGHYFSRSPRQACKISHMNEKNPAKHVKSPASVGKNIRK